MSLIFTLTASEDGLFASMSNSSILMTTSMMIRSTQKLQDMPWNTSKNMFIMLKKNKKKQNKRQKKWKMRKKARKRKRRRNKLNKLFKKTQLRPSGQKLTTMAKNTLKRLRKIQWKKPWITLNASLQSNLPTKAITLKTSYSEEPFPKLWTSLFSSKNLFLF